jgi:hydrogenase maturation factor HypE
MSGKGVIIDLIDADEVDLVDLGSGAVTVSDLLGINVQAGSTLAKEWSQLEPRM